MDSSFTIAGFLFIVVGALLVAIPYVIDYVIKHTPTRGLEQVPKILLYVYRKDGFYFVTSPILLIAGAALMWLLIRLPGTGCGAT